MTSQLSTSESSSSCSETDPNKSIKDLIELFTYEEDMLLLKQIQEKKQPICGCKVCSMDRLRRLAYQVAREKNKRYPKSWDKKKRAKSKWMKIFEQNYMNEISIFSSDFILLYRASTSEEQLLFNEFLTFEEEQSLLEHIKMTQKKNCICQQCIMTEILTQFTLSVITGMIILPESWNNEAKKKWLKDFKERHKNEISKFPNRCKLSKVNKQQSILTVEEEISLLRDVKENITKKDCICQKCLLKKVSVLAYELASDKNIPYPESWEKHKKAGSRWLKDFKVRYKDFISYFPTICKITSQPSTSGIKSSSSMENVSDVSLNSLQEEKNKSNIFIEIENILLFIKEEKMLKQMKKKSICGCDYCLTGCLKEAYEEACEELNLYPQSSNMNNEIVKKWFKNFEKRYKDEILMFPIRCKLKGSPSKRTVLSVNEELSLLKDIKKNSKEDCICQKCVLSKIPFLAYKLASSRKPYKYYPPVWKRHEKAGSQWMKFFERKHKSIISRFPTICTLTSSQSSISGSSFFSENKLNSLQEETSKINNLIEMQDILLFAKEKEILKQMMIDKQSVCGCKCCMMDRLENAYLEACEELKFSQSLNMDNEAIEKWFKNFEERYKDKVSKIPSRCKLPTQKQSILTIEEELSLLPDIEQNSNEEDCICQECILRKVSFLAYKLASDKNIPYPELWKKHKKAGLWWLKDFKAKHEIFISFYPTICKKTSFQPSTGGPTSSTENISELLNNLREELSKSNTFVEIEDILLFTKEEEILMEMIKNKQSVCGCKSCLMDHLKNVYQELCEKMKLYPQLSNMNNETVEKWFKNFEERYKDEISTFPFRCEESIEKQPIWTYEEELSLLKDIQENCTRADCQEYVMREASFLAYKLASNKNIPCPKSWKRHKKAGSRWLKDFKVRHNIFFSYFPTICKITSSQPSTSGSSSFFVENVFESFNISQKGMSKYNIPIEIGNILLFIKEEEILKQMMEDKQLVCGCECCLMNRLKKVYQEAREKLMLYPQSSNMDNEAVEMWFKNFEAKHRNKISKFPNRCKLSEESIKQQSVFTFEDELLLLVYIEMNSAKEDCICQECLLKEVSFLAYELASDNNVPYPESWEQHKKAELQWLKDFTKRHKNKILKFPLICKIISEEIKEHESSKLVFDLKQERSLLIDLIETNSARGDCICQKCVLEILPFLVYKLACNENLKNKTKEYPKSWNRSKKAGQHWMKKFIKRHEKEFAKLSFFCKINSSEPSTSKALI